MNNNTKGKFVEAIGVVDQNLNILQMSQRWSDLSGEKLASRKGADKRKQTNFLDLIYQPDRNALQKQLDKALQNDCSIDVETRLRREKK